VGAWWCRWGSGKVGIDEEEFNGLLRKENVNFMEVLVGADANLGVPVRRRVRLFVSRTARAVAG
jgi:hypothetical protein